MKRFVAFLAVLAFALAGCLPATAQTYPCSKLNDILATGTADMSNHPCAFFDTVRHAVATIAGMQQTTSGTGMAAATGSKSFALSTAPAWRLGTPLYITADAAPADAYMVGNVASTMAPGATTATVNVTAIGPDTSSYAAWTLRVAPSARTLSAPPLLPNQGGTGASTPAGARAALGLQGFWKITSVLSSPPGSPVNQQRHLVGASPTGVFALHEHEIATYNTSGSVWTYEVAAAGDNVFDLSKEALYTHTGVAQYSRGIYYGSKWEPLTPVKARWIPATLSGSHTIVSDEHGRWLTAINSSPATITLPNAGLSMEVVVEVLASNTGSTSIVISGGDAIRLADGTVTSSIVVPAGTFRLLHLVAGHEESANLWYVWR